MFTSVYEGRIKLKCVVMWIGYFLLLQQLTRVPNPRVAPMITNIIGIVYILKILYFQDIIFSKYYILFVFFIFL